MGDVRTIITSPPNRSAFGAGPPGISPEMTSLITISFFPVWDITIPLSPPSLLTASYFLDDSAVKAAAGDQ